MLEKEFYGHPLMTYVIIFGLAALALLSGAVVKLFWRLVLLPLARRKPGRLETLVLERTESVAAWLAPTAALYFIYLNALEVLKLPLEEHQVARAAAGAFFVLLAFLGAWAGYELVMSVIEWYLREMERRPDSTKTVAAQFTPIIGRVLKVVMFVIALIMVLDNFHVNVSGLLATAGIASLAVALAAQDTIANMISGFVVMADRSFRPGDRVKLANGVMGDVIDIGLRATRVLTYDETVVIVPNSELAKSQIVNYHYPTPRYKIVQKVSVAYGTDVQKVKAALNEIARNDPGVLKDPAPAVFFMEFAGSSLDLDFVYCIERHAIQRAVQDRINMAIQKRFAELKVEIPFPQQDVYIRTAAEAMPNGGTDDQSRAV